MDFNIKYTLNSVRIPYLNGSEEFKKNETFEKINDDNDNTVETINYKLMQIPESLIDVLQEENLIIKGDSKNLYLTTDKETFQVKQNFHSNCVLLLEQNKINNYTSYTTQQSELELVLTKIPLDTSTIPIYKYESDLLDEDDQNIEKKNNDITKDTLITSLPMSLKEFEEQWRGSLLIQLSDMTIKKIPYTIESDIIDLILMSVVSLNMKYTEIDCDAILNKVKSFKENDKNIDLLIKAVLEKFTDTNKSLKMKTIAIFYGLKTLRKKCPFSQRNFIELNDFYMYWKESFPSYFNCDLDIDFLIGYFAKDLVTNKILEIDPKRLPKTIQKRVPYLMNIQRTWEQKHIQPFFEELNEQGIKPDNFIMKFAKRKKDKSGKYIVTER